MRRTLLAGVALLLAACGDDPTAPSPTPARVAGTYSLAKVDGQLLPFLALDLGAYRVNVVSGTLLLRADGTYAHDVSHRTEDSGNIRTGTDTDVGTWNLHGDTITLASTKAVFSQTGVISGDAITLQSSSRVLVLTRQR